jgi:hypothetical protein
MYKFTIAFILSLLFVGLISDGKYLAAAQPIQQNTHGPNSPAAYTQKGNITININELKEIERVVREAIESYESGRDIERAELKKRIADIHKTQLGVLPQEADRWAEQFLSTLPLRKDRIIMQEEEEKVRFEKQRIQIPVLFEYSIKQFDEYILALRKRDSKIEFKQEQIPEIITYSNSDIVSDSFRIVAFPNGTVLKVRLGTGVIKNGRFAQQPYIWIKLIKNETEQSMLWMEQIHWAGRQNALPYGDGELTDEFKKRLMRAYHIMIEEAYLSSAEAPARYVKTVP